LYTFVLQFTIVIMSWWGSSGSDKDSSSSSSSASSSSYDTSSSFGTDTTQYATPSSSGGNLQEQLQLEQQKAMIQTVMLKLTDIGFEQCVSKPSSSLSSSEVSCINSVVGKYLETSEYVVAKLSQNAGAAGYN
jgi:hypothetical protein